MTTAYYVVGLITSVMTGFILGYAFHIYVMERYLNKIVKKIRRNRNEEQE